MVASRLQLVMAGARPATVQVKLVRPEFTRHVGIELHTGAQILTVGFWWIRLEFWMRGRG